MRARFRRRPAAVQHGLHFGGDFFRTAEEEEATPNGDLIANLKDAHLDRMAVDPSAVGALQIGEDNLAAVLLNLRVKAADPFVIQADRIIILAAERDRSWKIAKHQSALEAFEQL